MQCLKNARLKNGSGGDPSPSPARPEVGVLSRSGGCMRGGACSRSIKQTAMGTNDSASGRQKENRSINSALEAREADRQQQERIVGTQNNSTNLNETPVKLSMRPPATSKIPTPGAGNQGFATNQAPQARETPTPPLPSPTSNIKSATPTLRQTPSTVSTDVKLPPLPVTMALVVSAPPDAAKELPTLRILGATDPTGELKEKVYDTTLHCQWRVLAQYNTREALGPIWNGRSEWEKWVLSEKWTEDDVTIMKAWDEKMEDGEPRSSNIKAELPVDLFKAPVQDADGNNEYRLPQHFRIVLEIEPLIPKYPPLCMHQNDKLSKQTRDAIRNGAKQTQFGLLAKVDYDKRGPQVVECDISTYLQDSSPLPAGLSAKDQLKKRQKKRAKAIRSTEHTTSFKLVIEIDWPSWCKESEQASFLQDDNEPMGLHQDVEINDDCLQLLDDIPQQTPSSKSPLCTPMDIDPMAILSSSAVTPTPQSGVPTVFDVSSTVHDECSAAASAEPYRHFSIKRATELVPLKPPQTAMMTPEGDSKAANTSRDAENPTSAAMEHLFGKEHSDFPESKGEKTSHPNVPDTVARSLGTLANPPSVSGPAEVDDRADPEKDEIEPSVPAAASRVVNFPTAVVYGVAMLRSNPEAVAQDKSALTAPSISTAGVGLPHRREKGISNRQTGRATIDLTDESTIASEHHPLGVTSSVEIIDLETTNDGATATRPQAVGGRVQQLCRRSGSDPTHQKQLRNKDVNGLLGMPVQLYRRSKVGKLSIPDSPTALFATPRQSITDDSSPMMLLEPPFTPPAGAPSPASTLSSTASMPNPPNSAASTAEYSPVVHGHSSLKLREVSPSPSHHLCVWEFAGLKSSHGGTESRDRKAVNSQSKCLIPGCMYTFGSFQGLRRHLQKNIQKHNHRVVHIARIKDAYRIRVSRPQRAPSGNIWFFEEENGRVTSGCDQMAELENEELSALKTAPPLISNPAPILIALARQPKPVKETFPVPETFARPETLVIGRDVSRSATSTPHQATPVRNVFPISAKKRRAKLSTPLTLSTTGLETRQETDGQSRQATPVEKVVSVSVGELCAKSSTPIMLITPVRSSNNQATGKQSAMFSSSGQDMPGTIKCYWHLVDPHGRMVAQMRAGSRCNICKAKFLDFCHLRDHLKSPENHLDRSIKVMYSKDGKTCDIWVRCPEVCQPPFRSKLFEEDFGNQRSWRWLKRPGQSSASFPFTPIVPKTPTFAHGRSGQVLQEAGATETYLSKTVSPLNKMSPHKRCIWSSITWDKARLEKNDEQSRCILCDMRYPNFEKLQHHLKADNIHGDSSITIAYDSNPSACRILVDQLKWRNHEDEDQAIFEEVDAQGRRTRVRKRISSDGIVNSNFMITPDIQRVPPAKMTCFWTREEELKEDHTNECLCCRKRFTSFKDLRWHLAYSTMDAHEGCRIKIGYNLDGQSCHIDVSRRNIPKDTESYRHGFTEVFPDGVDVWQPITVAQPHTYDELDIEADSGLLPSATLELPHFTVDVVSCKWKFGPYLWGEDAREEETNSGQCLICLKQCGSFQTLRNHLKDDNEWHKWCVTILYGNDPQKVEICLENMPTLGLFFERKSKNFGVLASHAQALERLSQALPTKQSLSPLPRAPKVKVVCWDLDDPLRARFSTLTTYHTYACIVCNKDVFSTFEELQDHLMKDPEHKSHTVLCGGRRQGAKHNIKLSRTHSMQSPVKAKALSCVTESSAKAVPALAEDKMISPIPPSCPLSPSMPKVRVGSDKGGTSRLDACDVVLPTMERNTISVDLPERQFESQKPSLTSPQNIHAATPSQALKAPVDPPNPSPQTNGSIKPPAITQKERVNSPTSDEDGDCKMEMISEPQQIDRAPLLERAKKQQGGSRNQVLEAPLSLYPTPIDVVPSEPALDMAVQGQVSPNYQRASPPEPAFRTVPCAKNGSIIHNPVTHLPLGPYENLPQYQQDYSIPIQAHIDLTHSDKRLSDDDKDFIVVWDIYILANPSRGAITGWLPNTLKRFVLSNWVWLHQRPSRVPCFLKHVAALKAKNQITPEAARKAAMLLRPTLVPKEAWNRVERNCVWTAESLQHNKKNWTALWDSLRWQTERISGALTPAIHQTLEQFINVAGHLLVEREKKVLEKTIMSMLHLIVNKPDKTIDTDDGAIRWGDMATSDVVQMLHFHATNEADGELRRYLEARKEAFAAKITVDPELEEVEQRMRTALLMNHLGEFVGPEKWEWRRCHEVELHIHFLNDEISSKFLLTQLANLRHIGVTTDSNALPDSHPLVVQPPIIKPIALPNVPAMGKRLPIPKPVKMRGIMECKCGLDVAPFNVVYCANRKSRTCKWPHSAYHRLCVDVERASEDGHTRQKDWFCEECRKKGWDSPEPLVVDVREIELDEGDEVVGLPDAGPPCAVDNNTNGSAQYSAVQQRDKSSNPQPRKKQKVATSREADVARGLIFAHYANSASGSSQSALETHGILEGTNETVQSTSTPQQDVSGDQKRSVVDEPSLGRETKRMRRDEDRGNSAR